MNPLERFQRLAEQARSEPVPAVDVAAGVLARLRAPATRRTEETPLWVAAAVSLAAASIVVVLALQAWLALSDPLAGLFYPLVMQ
jgi:hypothetical protein